MTRNSKGCLMMVVSPLILLGILILWGVISYVAANLVTGGTGSGGDLQTALRVVNVGFGFIGILSVIGTPIGLIIGLVYILTAPKPPQEPPQPSADPNQQTPT